MVAVFADEETVRSLIKEDATIAAFNTPNTLVISGTLQNLSNIIEKCNSQGIKTTPLKVSHAFHSPLMTPMLGEFRKIAAEITYHQPQIPLISNVTGKSINQDIATPEYWCEHIIKSVRFADSIATLKQLDAKMWLEIALNLFFWGWRVLAVLIFINLCCQVCVLNKNYSNFYRV